MRTREEQQVIDRRRTLIAKLLAQRPCAFCGAMGRPMVPHFFGDQHFILSNKALLAMSDTEIAFTLGTVDSMCPHCHAFCHMCWAQGLDPVEERQKEFAAEARHES